MSLSFPIHNITLTLFTELKEPVDLAQRLLQSFGGRVKISFQAEQVFHEAEDPTQLPFQLTFTQLLVSAL